MISTLILFQQALKKALWSYPTVVPDRGALSLAVPKTVAFTSSPMNAQQFREGHKTVLESHSN
jgi:hypothetical protein